MYHIELDKAVIESHNWKVPASMLTYLKTKLDSLEKNKLLKKIDYPTNWLNNMVAVGIPNRSLHKSMFGRIKPQQNHKSKPLSYPNAGQCSS